MFALCVIKLVCHYLQIKFETNKLFLIEHVYAYRILLPSETDDSRFNLREIICSQTQFSHIINRLLTSLVRSVL